MKSLESFRNLIGSKDLLCHYTSFKTASCILQRNELKLGSLGKSKDAIESINLFSELGGLPNNVEDCSKSINEEIKNNIKIVCFSKDDKECKPGMMLARMWSQYGDNHKGVCLIFERDKIENQFKKLFDDMAIVDDVKYDQVPFFIDTPLSASISISKDNEELKVEENKFPKLLQNLIMQKILFSKMSDFRDENERRFLCYNNEKKSDLFFSFEDSLKAVILGFNSTFEQEKILKTICNNNNLLGSVKFFKEEMKCRRQISKKNIHNPSSNPYIDLNPI